MRRRVTALVAFLALAAVPLAGCGDKAPGLAKRDATELIRLLKRAQTASDDPQTRCPELLAGVRELAAKVRALPSKVDRDVRDTLSNGVRNLAAAASAECQQSQTTPTITTTTPTTTTTPPPTTETTPPPTTETTPPPTTETTPPPTTPPIPTTPDTGGTGPGNNGNGNGNGNNGKRGGNR